MERLDSVAATVALLTADLPTVEVFGDNPPDADRPCVVVSEANLPADPDLPIIAALLDVKTYAGTDPGAENAARDLAARVFAHLHRRYGAEATYDGMTFRLYTGLHAAGGQSITDPDTHEPYVLDTYELKWSTHPIRFTADADAAATVAA